MGNFCKYVIVPGCIEKLPWKKLEERNQQVVSINQLISQHTCLAIALLSNLL